MATNTTPSYPQSRRSPRQLVNTLKRTLNYNDADIALASFGEALPQGAFVLDVKVEIVTAFNAGSTNPITVGTNSSTYNNLIASGDNTPATPGVYFNSGTTGTTKLGRAFAAAADTPVYATYKPTGTAATTGQAVIVITYEGGWSS